MAVFAKAMVRFQVWTQRAIMGAQYVPSQRTYTAMRIVGLFLVIVGIIVGVVFFKNGRVASLSQSSRPVITSIAPDPVSTGGTVTIAGQNLDIVRDESSPMHPVATASITDTKGQTGLIFLPQGSAERIDFPLPAKACKKEFSGLGQPGSCPANGYMDITSGKYSISVDVSGRPGSSNSMELDVK